MTHGSFEFVSPLPESTPRSLVVRISGRIRRKRELFGVLKKRLGLPGYFGGNWDALHDSLRDLSWVRGVDEVVLAHDGVPFHEGGRLRAIYLELLTSLVSDPPSGLPRVRVVFPELCAGMLREK